MTPGFPSITSAVRRIYSARYAGTGSNDGANIVKLLAALDGVPVAQRRAHFNCVLVYMRPRKMTRHRSSATAAGPV